MSALAWPLKNKPQYRWMWYQMSKFLSSWCQGFRVMLRTTDSTLFPVYLSLGSIPFCPLLLLLLAGLEFKFCDFVDTSVLPSFQTHFWNSITYWILSPCNLLKSSVPTPVSNHCLTSFLVSPPTLLLPECPFLNVHCYLYSVFFFFLSILHYSPLKINTSMFSIVVFIFSHCIYQTKPQSWIKCSICLSIFIPQLPAGRENRYSKWGDFCQLLMVLNSKQEKRNMLCPEGIYNEECKYTLNLSILFYHFLIYIYYTFSSILHRNHLSLNHQYLSGNNLSPFTEKIRASIYEHTQLLHHFV